jgi:hypothetical protein
VAKSTPLQQLQEQADVPQTKAGKLFMAMPVIMTVIATLLAGLASGEMTKAQYDRAYAAQLQSKAGDQWAFFQAKRLRGELQRNTIDVLASTGAMLPAGSAVEAPKPSALVAAPEVSAALEAAHADAPPETINPLLQALAEAPLAAALKSAKDRVANYDTLTAPLIKAAEVTAISRLTFNAARYDVEAKLVADIARLYEIQVRKTNLSAERHHLRSQRFFFGMLAAQAAVIVSTFALAARQRNLLWGFAAAAGVLAVVFAIYVYVYV